MDQVKSLTRHHNTLQQMFTIACYTEVFFIGILVLIHMAHALGVPHLEHLTPLYNLSVGSTIALGLLCPIIWCTWLYRVVAYTQQTPEAKVGSPAWHIITYCIPIYSLYKPFAQMRTLWTLHAGDGISSTFITSWWLFFHLSTMANTAADSASWYVVVVASVVQIAGLCTAKTVARQLTTAIQTAHLKTTISGGPK